MKAPRVHGPIRRLVTMAGVAAKHGRKPSVEDLSVIDDAAIAVDADGNVRWIGEARHLPASLGMARAPVDELWFPGWVDCHTHFLFAGSRAHDFARRSTGMSYAEVARAGGGILSTVRATREASEDELLALGRERLAAFARRGVAVVEGKTGYALALDSELRCLDAYRKLDGHEGVEVLATFLPAHAVPPEYRGRKSEYVDELCARWIGTVGERRLARFADVFVEDGYFDLDDARRIGVAAKAAGLGLKIHADQFHDAGATALAVELGATSVDHGDHASAAAIATLADSETVAVMLPAASLYAGTPFPPARKFLDAGAIVALSTDFNPGTSPTTNLPLVTTLGCTQLKMTVPEALAAVTFAAAKALGLSATHGSLEVGKKFVATAFTVPTVDDVPASFGEITARIVR
jgi:imidazolonepropionase